MARTKEIQHPRLGQLAWRDDQDAWVGQIELPKFAACRVLSAEKASPRHRFEICIYAESASDPLPESVESAVRVLIDEEQDVLTAVLGSILKTYRTMTQTTWTIDGPQTFDLQSLGIDLSVPIKSTEDLEDHVQLERVTIDSFDHDSIAQTTYVWTTPIDEEHGLQVEAFGARVEDEIPDFASLIIDPAIALSKEFEPFKDPVSDQNVRFVDLKIANRWHSGYVVDERRLIVASIQGTLARTVYDANDIQDVRRMSTFNRWRAGNLAGRLAVASHLIGLTGWPLLVAGWFYPAWPWWCCLVVTLFGLLTTWFFRRSYISPLAWVRLGLVTIALVFGPAERSIVESQDMVAHEVNRVGNILWRFTVLVNVAGIAALLWGVIRAIKQTRKQFEWLIACTLCVVLVSMGLIATSRWGWSPYHLLWILPASLVGTIVLSLILVSVGVAQEPMANCPKCGQQLATAKAQQCLACGADWHGTRVAS